MPKKEERKFQVQIKKNMGDGGAWLSRYSIYKGVDDEDETHFEAHKNASAAKRWVKAQLQEITGRKSMKFNVIKEDDNGKPITLTGYVMYKVTV